MAGTAVGGASVERDDPVAVGSNGELAGGTALALDEPLSEAELTALALAADPEQPLAADAVPLSVYLAQVPGLGSVSGLLPQWYMPQAMASSSGRGRRWRTAIILAIIAAFVAIEAYGLCSTYGQVVLA
jgi:hypothetical protein